VRRACVPCKANKNARVIIHNPLAIDVMITEFVNIVVTYYSKCVSALRLISENVKSKILECGPFSGGRFSIHFSNNYIQQTSTLISTFPEKGIDTEYC
jgi:hypothetical protein